MFGIMAAVEVISITWLLSNALNLIATIGENATAGGTSATFIEEYDDALGLVISNPAVPAGKAASRGMRKSTDIDEGGSVASPVFLNSVSKADATLLHPVKVGTSGEDIFIVYQPWVDSVVVPAGGVLTDFDGVHCFYYSSVNGGTTSGTGVADDTGVTDWIEQGKYNNIQKNENGDGWLTHVLNEPTRVNTLLHSQNFSDSYFTQAGGAISDAGVAPDGSVSEMFTCAAGAGPHRVFRNLLQIGNNNVLSVYAKAGTADFISVTDGGTPGSVGAYFDLASGVVGTVGVLGGVTATISNAGGGWWRCSINTTSSVNGFWLMQFFTSDDQDPNWIADGTETVFVWQGDAVNASTVSSPIPTTTGSVQRNATSFLLTPTPAEFLRLRFADVQAQTYLSSGTIEVSYDGTTLTWTDGANAMTHVVAMKPGDIATGEEATGKLYYNGSLVDTNGSYSPTWGEIALGNAVDYIFDAELDPTDTTWSDPS
jgi:hypothetical protein